jgi:hypothetical protein
MGTLPDKSVPIFLFARGCGVGKCSLGAGMMSGRKESMMGKLVSMKQREANRRNAQRSTGPKTVEGKSAVKWNALKHGLLAKAVVLPQEDRGEYERLLAGLAEYWQPVGMLEQLFVEEIASIIWRRRRAVRAETAKIESGMMVASIDAESTLTRIYPEAAARNIGELCRSVAGLQRLSEAFDDMAREIRQDGKLSEESIAWLEAYEVWSDKELDALRGETTVTDTAKKELLESILGFIAIAKKKFARHRKIVEAQEAALRDMASARVGILEDTAGEAILRYEGAMDRKLYTAIAQLERLQRERRGETVPPPIRVDVTKTA